MTTAVDNPPDSNSLLASRDPDLTARFVDDALPYLNQLDDRAHRLTGNAAIMGSCQGTAMHRLRRGCQRLSILLRTTHERA